MEPKFLVCRGKKCRRTKKEHDALLDELSDVAVVKVVGCRKICQGPVVGYVGEGGPAWFERVDSKKSRKGLVKLAARGKISKPLRKRLVKKK
jgi:hypothetical protein